MLKINKNNRVNIFIHINNEYEIFLLRVLIVILIIELINTGRKGYKEYFLF